MTDAAVIADSGAAPDDVGGAVINENAPGFNSPLGSQIPPDAQAKPEAPAKPASLDDSIDRAMAKAEAKAKQPEPAKAEPKPEAKAEAKEPQARGEGGKFTATAKTPEPAKTDAAVTAGVPQATKQSFTAGEAPARFSEDAKKEWAAAPESVRRESERAIKELTEGFAKYKTAAERDGALNEFHEMAKASGKDLPNVVRSYVAMENKLRTDLVGGLEDICQRVGVSLRDVAAHVMGQTPDQQASQQSAVIRELNSKISQLEQQLGGVTQTIQQQRHDATLTQRHDATLTEVNQFAAAHPRFEELADAISEELKHGYSLSEAYSRAERLNPAPAAAAKEEPPAASSAAQNDPPPVQPDKGQKSINGAPSPGSSPAAKKRVARSLDESLDAAFGRVG
jgi:hypothetical protein